MMGTLAAVLASKGIQSSQDLYRAEISGDIEDVNGVLKITRINVHYFLRVPDGNKADAQEALKIYLSKCPAAQSVIGCIAIKDELTLES